MPSVCVRVYLLMAITMKLYIYKRIYTSIRRTWEIGREASEMIVECLINFHLLVVNAAHKRTEVCPTNTERHVTLDIAGVFAAAANLQYSMARGSRVMNGRLQAANWQFDIVAWCSQSWIVPNYLKSFNNVAVICPPFRNCSAWQNVWMRAHFVN